MFISEANPNLELLAKPVCSRSNIFTTSPTQDPAVRLLDLLATLEELQLALARTGLGSLKAGENGFASLQSLIAGTTAEVQSSFKTRQQIREGAGVAKSVLR